MKELNLPDKIESLWTATTPSTSYTSLKGKIKSDVIIIGGGIAGINAAYFLKRAGLKVVIIESNYIASGTSGNTTSKVTSQHELKYQFLEKKFGKEKARVYADSNQWAIKELDEIIKREKIDCDFHRLPAYIYATTKKDLDKVKKEVEVAKELSLPASFVDSAAHVPFKFLGAIKFEDQAYFHPRKFLLAIAEIVNKDGSHIFEKTEGLNVRETNNLCEVETDRGKIKGRYVIVATNFPFYDKKNVFNKLQQIRSHVLAVNLGSATPQGMFIGPREENLSFRPHKIGRKELFIIGGVHEPAEKDVDVTKDYQKLKKSAQEKFNIKSVKFRWSAEDTIPLDRVPYIGSMPGSRRIFVITGFGAWGITTSFVSARLLTDLILGIKNEWVDLYNPGRIESKGGDKYGSEAK